MLLSGTTYSQSSNKVFKCPVLVQGESNVEVGFVTEISADYMITANQLTAGVVYQDHQPDRSNIHDSFKMDVEQAQDYYFVYIPNSPDNKRMIKSSNLTLLDMSYETALKYSKQL